MNRLDNNRYWYKNIPFSLVGNTKVMYEGRWLEAGVFELMIQPILDNRHYYTAEKALFKIDNDKEKYVKVFEELINLGINGLIEHYNTVL